MVRFRQRISPQARASFEHGARQQFVHLPELLQTVFEPQPEPAGVLHDATDLPRVAGFRRVTHSGHHMASAGQDVGDAAVDRTVVFRPRREQPFPAVVADQRMHEQHVVVVADRLREAVQPR